MTAQQKFARISVCLIPVCIVLGGSFAIPAKVGRTVVDDQGVEITDEFGHPVYEIDHWATWKLNWFPNLMFIASGVLLIFVLYSWIYTVIQNLKVRRSLSGKNL